MPLTMTKEMTSTELRELIGGAEALERDTFDPRVKGEFKFEDSKLSFELDDERYKVTPDAYTRLGQIAGIPKNYLIKTPHSLMVPHVNYHLRNSSATSLVMARTGETIQLFSKITSVPVSNSLLIDGVEAVMGEDLKVHHVSHDMFSTRFSLVNQAVDHEVKRGDIIRTGISVENSYALSTPLTVSAYVHRLVCTNGAISADNIFRMSRKVGGDDEYAGEWVANAITQAYDASEVEIERLRAMQEIRVQDHVSGALSSVFSEFGVPLQVRQEITDRMMDERVVSMYDLYNTITWMGSNSEASALDAAIANRLMQIGGRIARHPEVCGECHRVSGR